jgi:hypothetical protein
MNQTMEIRTPYQEPRGHVRRDSPRLRSNPPANQPCIFETRMLFDQTSRMGDFHPSNGGRGLIRRQDRPASRYQALPCPLGVYPTSPSKAVFRIEVNYRVSFANRHQVIVRRYCIQIDAGAIPTVSGRPPAYGDNAGSSTKIGHDENVRFPVCPHHRDIHLGVPLGNYWRTNIGKPLTQIWHQAC